MWKTLHFVGVCYITYVSDKKVMKLLVQIKDKDLLTAMWVILKLSDLCVFKLN